MVKVYLDTNVFSKFKNGELKDLLTCLQQISEKEMLFFFSQAHINDLHRDNTENKFEEFRVIENICNNNFLQYDPKEDTIKYLLANPFEAYDSFKPEDELYENWMGTIFHEIMKEDESGIFKSVWESVENQEIDLQLTGYFEGEMFSAEQMLAREVYNKIGIEKSRYTVGEWFKVVGKIMDNFQNDDSVIREIRRLSKIHINVDKFKVNIDEIKFNENLAKTAIGKSFLELLEDQLEINSGKDKVISIFNRVTAAYSMLNIYGFDNEQNKKVKFMNMQHDSQHCFYATSSDILVSNDKGFRHKTKFIYNLYGQETEVYSIEEFASMLEVFISRKPSTVQEFNQMINYDLKNGISTSTNVSIQNEQAEESLKLSNKYFNFFNRISRITLFADNSKYIILYHDSAKIYHMYAIKDYSSVTNQLIELMGVDLFFKDKFDEEDFEKLNLNEWEGRLWNVEGITYQLLKSPYSGRLILQIGPLIDDFCL